MVMNKVKKTEKRVLPDNAKPYRQLACAVIQLALEDLASDCHMDRADAAYFLLAPEEEQIFWFAMAGVNQPDLSEKIRRWIWMYRREDDYKNYQNPPQTSAV